MNDNLIYQTLQKSAEKWPNKIAIHDSDGSLSFGKLLEEVDQLKAILLSAGIKEKSAIGLVFPNNRKIIIGIFAVTACNCIVMPLATHLTSYEANATISNATLNYVIEDKSIEKDIKMDLLFENQSILIRKNTSQKTLPSEVKFPAFMRFTSGTTGKSKGVIISQNSAIERIDAANKSLQLGVNDTVIWVLPIAYHFVVSILLYVKYGVTISIVKNFMAKNIIEACQQHNGTLLYCSPFQIKLLSKDQGKEMMPSLHTIISTSSGISKETCVAFKNRFGKDVFQAYGLIEVGLPIINREKSNTHPEAVGNALPDYEVAILNKDYKPLPDGETGMLGIKGPGMFDAYLEPFKLKKEVLKNGYFITSDFAVKNKGLVQIKGRKKSVLNLSGNKVFPEEVEAVIEEYPNIKLSKVSGVEHPLLGTVVQAEIVCLPEKTIDVEELISFCRKKLTHFKVPQKIHFVDSIELTPTGKIKR